MTTINAIKELTMVSVFCFHKWRDEKDKDYHRRYKMVMQAIKDLENIQSYLDHSCTGCNLQDSKYCSSCIRSMKIQDHYFNPDKAQS